MKKSYKYLALIFALVSAIILLLTTFLSTKSSASSGWTRSLEPVVVPSNGIYHFVPLEEVFAYSYRNGVWEQIPLQIDRINGQGEYSEATFVVLNNDELVFMAKDLGDRAGTGNWISNADSRNHQRYQIQVTDPLNPTEVGYVYLYRSETLTKTHGDYVTYDESSQLISTGTYTITFGEDFFGFEQISFVDYEQDILDRSKFRMDVVCRRSGDNFEYTINEELLAMQGEDLMELNPSIDGPVRAGGGKQDLYNWFYDSSYDVSFFINFNNLDDVVCDWFPLVNFGYIESFRYSLDWLNPEDTGMATMTYFDSNSEDGYVIDGSADSVPDSPIPGWTQVSGNLGSIISISSVDSFVTGSLSHYYKDDSVEDIYDPSDYKSFGDTGILAAWLPETPKDEYGTLAVKFLTFFLGMNQPNVGDTYAAYADEENALETAVSSQDYEPTIYFPIILR